MAEVPVPVLIAVNEAPCAVWYKPDRRLGRSNISRSVSSIRTIRWFERERTVRAIQYCGRSISIGAPRASRSVSSS